MASGIDPAMMQELASEYRGLRPQVLAFAVAMETKLRINDHKGGWDQSEPEDLLLSLDDEVAELRKIIDSRRFAKMYGYPLEDSDSVLFEAADVANFAMMVADVCGALIPDER